MSPHRYRRLASLLLVPLLLPAAAAGESPPSSPSEEARGPEPSAMTRLPGGLEVQASRIVELPEEDGYLLEGAVSIRSGRSRIQADRIELRQACRKVFVSTYGKTRSQILAEALRANQTMRKQKGT